MQINKDKVSIIATSHHSFAGGGKNKTRILHELAERGYEVEYIGLKKPHLFENILVTKVKIHICHAPLAHAHEFEGLLLESALVEKITEICIEKIQENKLILLWGSNLFPFVSAAYTAKLNIEHQFKINIPLISFPVGSDIWQVGPKSKNNVKRLLFSDSINCSITYTQKFADEIYLQYGKTKKIEIIPPILDTKSFYYINETERQNNKKKIGLSKDSIVVIHHSNMRPIKNPQEVIDIVYSTSKIVKVSIVLLMIGPIPANVYNSELLKSWKHIINNEFQVHSKDNFRIFWTGIVPDVMKYLKYSDIAINCSIHDSFNISLMEALATGIPCISSDVVGVAPHIVNSNGGYLYRINGFDVSQTNDVIQNIIPFHSDKSEAIEKLKYLINNEYVRVEKGLNASNYFHNTFCPEVILTRFETIFEKLLLEHYGENH